MTETPAGAIGPQTRQGARPSATVSGEYLWGVGYIIYVLILPPWLISESVYVASCILLSGLFLVYMRVLPFFPAVFGFLGLVCVYMGLSLVEAFPIQRREFDPGFILRHAAAYILFPVVIPCFYLIAPILFHDRVRQRAIWGLLIVAALIAVTLRSSENILVGPRLYGTLTVPLLIQFLLTLGIMQSRLPIYLKVLLLILTFPLMGAASNQVLHVLAISMAILGFYRVQVVAAAIALVLAIVLLILLEPAELLLLRQVDPNIYNRVILWEFLLEEILDNRFVGFGFGTSWGTFDTLLASDVRNIIRTEERAQVVANHNSFLDVLNRLGLLGLGLFLAMIWEAAKPLAPSPERFAQGFLLALVVLICMVNPALESGRSVTFVGFAFGCLYYLQAIRGGRRPPFLRLR